MSVVVVGLGDLGLRIAERLAQLDLDLVLAGRSGRGPSLAALVASSGRARVRFIEVDVADQSSVERLLRSTRPRVLVQCASLLSPWTIAACQTPTARMLRAAGFAAQLPAQLPLVATVMLAARTVDFAGAVINCSYPDVTHPILATRGLAPTVGAGNAAMIQARVDALLRQREGAGIQVRVLAHHAQVRDLTRGEPPPPADRARIYLGDSGDRADELPYAGAPLPDDRSLNSLSASSAVLLARSFLPDAAPLHHSAPGPHGLPGGWPLRVVDGLLALDLPPGVALDEAERWQWRQARRDGVERVDSDGTTHFTDEAAAALRGIDEEMAEPLRFEGVLSRWDRLRKALS